MKDESRKRLTEYLGECWHEYVLGQGLHLSKCSCGHTGMSVRDICTRENRDFTTYNDLGALKDKLCENEEWDDFLFWAKMKYFNINIFRRLHFDEDFTIWLFRPESCALVNEHLKSKEGK